MQLICKTMTEKQDKKQEAKEDSTKAEKAKQELSDEDLDGLRGGGGEDFDSITPILPNPG